MDSRSDALIAEERAFFSCRVKVTAGVDEAFVSPIFHR